jgi:hypothetical protein
MITAIRWHPSVSLLPLTFLYMFLLLGASGALLGYFVAGALRCVMERRSNQALERTADGAKLL